MRGLDRLFLWSYCMQKNRYNSGRAIFGAFITVVVFFEAIFISIANALWYFTTFGINLKTGFKTAIIISIVTSVLVSAYYLTGMRYKSIISNFDPADVKTNKKNSFKALALVSTVFGLALLSYLLIN